MNLILGGTHGLGLEIAQAYHASGEDTFVTGRSYTEADHEEGMAIDLSDQKDIDKLDRYLSGGLGKQIIKRFLWVAGYGYLGDFAQQPDPEKMAAVNFTNIMPIAQSVWQKQLGTDEATSFVVVSSTSGYKARKDEAVYAATKHAQIGFARSLGLESERLNSQIRVSLFMPGGMQTPFWKGNEPNNFNEFLDPAKVAQHIVEVVAAQRISFYEETIERGSL
jgi:short-subunit dehydrogenase